MKHFKFSFAWLIWYLTESLRFYVTNTDGVQAAKLTAIAAGTYTELAPNELGGRVRLLYFTFTTLAAGGADGDSYNLNRLPKGARVIGGFTANGAMGAGVVAKIGITGTLDKYGSAIDMAAAGADNWTQTAATYGLETTAEENLIMTLTGAAPAASITVKGHLLYVLD